MITIKKPKSPHQSTLSLITLLTSTIKNSTIVTSHPLNSKIQIDIIQDVLPKYLIIYKPNKIRIALKICDYKHLPIINPSNTNQLVLNNFSTQVGESLAMLLMDIFTCNVDSKQIISFTVKNEFLYFRMYKFCFSKSGPVFNRDGPFISFRVVKVVEYFGDEKRVLEFFDFSKSRCML